MKIIVDQQWAEVTETRDHEAGEHPSSPIRDDLRAREWVTGRGSRWSGLRPDNTPFHDPTAPASSTTRHDLASEGVKIQAAVDHALRLAEELS